ncbi:MAG: hypothetical protein ACREQ5_01645 [Candidatus Dormibacteria bacterium]
MAASEPTTYTIVSSIPTTDIQPGGNLVSGQRFQYQTSNGITGFVFVPQSIMGNVSAVRALIETDVTQLVNVHKLTGQVG